MNLQKHKKAWADFIEWYVELWYPWRLEKEFTDLPFEMQLGVYLKYLYEKGIKVYLVPNSFSSFWKTVSYEIHYKIGKPIQNYDVTNDIETSPKKVNHVKEMIGLYTKLIDANTEIAELRAKVHLQEEAIKLLNKELKHK